MPMATKEAQREYQRTWMAKRRSDWFSENGPCVVCGSWDNLELDHIDPQTKVSHRIWSWAKSRRNAELAKCQVLCTKCHDLKTLRNQENAFGEHHGMAKYSEQIVRAVRERHKAGASLTSLDKEFGLPKGCAWDLVNNTWQHLN